MELIFKRRQHRGILGRTRFVLHARFSLGEEERELIYGYCFHHAVMIDIPNPGLWVRSILLAIAISPFIFFLLGFLVPWQFWQVLNQLIPLAVHITAAFVSVLMGFIYYHQKRTTIYVRDLIHGRYFNCPSVIELARTEATLYAMSDYFRQVLESAKNWGGEEKFDIPPLPVEEAKQSILKGPFM